MHKTTIVVDGVQYVLHVMPVKNEHNVVTSFEVFAFELAHKDCRGQTFIKETSDDM